MPVDFTGYWKMLANENFEEYLRALGKQLPAALGPGRPGQPLEDERWALRSPPEPAARLPPLGPAFVRWAAKGPRLPRLRGWPTGCQLGGWVLLELISGKHLIVGSGRG